MSKPDAEKTADQGISKVKLALGAASLFLFIIGVKRTFRMDAPETPDAAPPPQPKKKKKKKK